MAAFVNDLEERGLSERILLIATGEMGRTPQINRNGGRDHWAKLTPLLLYGGGMPRGKVIGQSTRDGGEPVADTVTTENLISTILHRFVDTDNLPSAIAAMPWRVRQAPHLGSLLESEPRADLADREPLLTQIAAVRQQLDETRRAARQSRRAEIGAPSGEVDGGAGQRRARETVDADHR